MLFEAFQLPNILVKVDLLESSIRGVIGEIIKDLLGKKSYLIDHFLAGDSSLPFIT